MKITRKFTTQGHDPFASVKWVKRSSKIANPDGTVVFQMDDAEVPETWSQLATDIMVSKYFRRAGLPVRDEKGNQLLKDGKPQTTGEKSARQVIHRLAGCWRHWGEKHGYFDTPNDAQAFYDELAYMMVHQIAAPNSPQWFNTGLNWAYGITGPAQGHFVPDPKTGQVTLAKDAYTHPQPHACFIQSVEDDLVNAGGIMDLWTREARLFKYGSGTGTNFSKLRGENESLSGGGKSSGLMSWLKIGDRAAGAIKSGGTTRRAAKMVCLDMDHPDIETFINWKVREEIKVQALVEGLKTIRDKKANATDAETIGQTADRLGLKLDYDFNGESYQTVSGQNSNNSVRIPDAFFDSVDQDGEWGTTFRTNGKPGRSFKARKLWDEIGYAAWRCADPGVQFDSTINAWHTCPSAGRINASNPCVTGDTLVSTSTGYRRIIDLVGRMVEVIDADGGKSWVEHVFKTGTKPVYELKTRGGYSLKLTADHRVLTANRGDVPAAELTVDDVVILRQPGFGDAFLPEQMGEIIGAALGDGCITRQPKQDHLFISLAAGEGDVARRLHDDIEHCKDWLDVGDARSTRSTTPVTTQTGVRVGTSVRALVDLLSRYAVLDAGSEHKLLTDAVFTLDRRTQAAILRGLFTTDGTVADYAEKSQYVSLDSTSLGLLRQVQLLLLGFGVKAKLYENRRALNQTTAMLPDGKGGHAEYPVQQIHSLRISRSSRVVFEREVGFMPESPKHAALAKLNQSVSAYADSLTDRIASLTPCGVEDVYDLTEPRTHHFVANGVVVHNCSEYMFLDNTACNLASINVLRFYNPASRSFDVLRFEHAVDLWTVVLEISVLMAAYPSKEVAELSWKYRTLGLGYANLGAMLMQAGIPYDSEASLAVCGCMSAMLTGRSYRQSALMASQMGPFAGFAADRDNMLRVMRNHARAAHGIPRDSGQYEGVRSIPVPIDHEVMQAGPVAGVTIANADELLEHAGRAWDEAVSLGEKFGYRNAQTTVIAPTGTIGLLMDCDTTGIEPDFALVKFKKLAGGGYFKIANASVRPALEALGYSVDHIREIMHFLLGRLSLDVPLPAPATGTLAELLLSRGLSREDLAKITDSLPGVFELSFAFTAWGLGDQILTRAGVDPAAAKADPAFNLLRHFGLSRAQIDALNTTICGTQTVEGAPNLKAEHLPVFDCANTCGKTGKRYILPEGHIRMMAAAQPFISGAISKTINLPNSATVEDIKACYRLSWELGLKANALYRDGCKLSQPLNSTSDSSTEEKAEQQAKKPAASAPAPARSAATPSSSSPIDAASLPLAAPLPLPLPEPVIRIVERPMRRRLSETRASITHKFNIAGHEGYLTVGLYDDGMPGELFITMAKEGSTIGGLMDSLGTAVSVALQYGVPIESLVNKFTHQRFEPAGMTANRDIPFAKSLVDYIFRWMGMEFIPGYREANAPVRGVPTPPLNTGHAASDLEDPSDRAAAASAAAVDGPARPVKEDKNAWSDRIHKPQSAGTAARGTIPSRPATGSVDATEDPSDGVLAATNRKTAAVSDGPTNGANGHAGAKPSPAKNARSAGTAVTAALSLAMQNNMGDAPACDGCGAITVRSGTCYKCLNCGNSMGCS